jgi:hypothetical protein
MAEQGFLGVACEPGLIFQICNQPNMIGFRLHDLIYGGSLSSDAEKGYVAAWKEFGMVDEQGNFKTLVMVNSRTPVTVDNSLMNCWLMTLLHSWNPEIVERQYPILMRRFLRDGPEGTKWVKPARDVPDDDEELMLPVNDFAWAACAASEVGDTETLDGLLGYADLMLNPAWRDGGYYYKRRDANFDENGYFIGMDSAAGNALLHYARLNVKDGLNLLYAGPLDDAHFAQPALIDLPEDVDVRRAVFDRDRQALAITLGALHSGRTIRLGIRAPADADRPEIVRDEGRFDGVVERTDGGLMLTFHHLQQTTLVLQW